MKIYKLINENNLVYFGKTKSKYLSSRLAVHKSQALTERKINKCKSKILFENNSTVKIELLEEFDNDDKLFIANREKYYIENFDCINKCIPNNTKKRVYNYDFNKYYHDNKHKIKSLQKYKCDCGMEIQRVSKYRHIKTKFHLNFLNNDNNDKKL